MLAGNTLPGETEHLFQAAYPDEFALFGVGCGSGYSLLGQDRGRERIHMDVLGTSNSCTRFSWWNVLLQLVFRMLSRE